MSRVREPRISPLFVLDFDDLWHLNRLVDSQVEVFWRRGIVRKRFDVVLPVRRIE